MPVSPPASSSLCLPAGLNALFASSCLAEYSPVLTSSCSEAVGTLAGGLSSGGSLTFFSISASLTAFLRTLKAPAT